MTAALITIRRARPRDAPEIAGVHDVAWRDAYRGIIPGRELEKMVARRGPDWWQAAINHGSRLLVLEFDELIAGYVSYGRNRVTALPYQGEIFELYLAPEFQGVGFGQRLFDAARRDLQAFGYNSTLVWALSDNDRAIGFYKHLGGRIVRQAHERFAGEMRGRVAFGYD